MATAVVRTAPGVTVSIARDPALVRTVRLVAAAVARRTGRDEDFVEEVRLAIGEACALLIGSEDDDNDGPVVVQMTIDTRLRVEVTSVGPFSAAAGATGDHDKAAAHGRTESVEPWVLLRGLIGDFTLDQSDAQTTLTMSWPVS